MLNTKNGDDRTVPIPDILYDELKSIRQETKIRKIKNDYIFKNTIGGQNDRLISKINDLLKRLGVTKEFKDYEIFL